MRGHELEASSTRWAPGLAGVSSSPLLRALAQGQPAALAALGDSLTHGYLVGRSYLDDVADELRRRFPGARLTVHNHGVCGDTAADGLARLDQTLALRPDCLLVQFGLNDAFGGMSAASHRDYLGRIIAASAAALPACDIVLVPAPPVADPLFDARAQALRDVAWGFAAGPAEHGDARPAQPGADHRPNLAEGSLVKVAPVAELWRRVADDRDRQAVPAPRLWLADGVHPTPAGYALIAQAVLVALVGGRA